LPINSPAFGLSAVPLPTKIRMNALIGSEPGAAAGTSSAAANRGGAGADTAAPNKPLHHRSPHVAVAGESGTVDNTDSVDANRTCGAGSA
jgi:hypothetical protein